VAHLSLVLSLPLASKAIGSLYRLAPLLALFLPTGVVTLSV
jgi:hypothetical protein